MRALPNLISLFRLASAPLLAWLIIESRFRTAFAVIILAGVSDWLDGYAARRLKLDGKLGVILDPLADKVLLVVLFLALAWVHIIPFWMLGLAIGRDLVIVIGAALLRLLRGVQRFLPTMLGKISTFFQIVLVLLALGYAAFPYPFVFLLKMTALAISALFTAWSGLDYIRIGVKLTRATSRQNRKSSV